MCGIGCCKDCTKRHVGCHSECDIYLKEKQIWEEKKKKLKENQAVLIHRSDFEMLACMHRQRKDNRR